MRVKVRVSAHPHPNPNANPDPHPNPLRGQGNKRITIRTSALEEKATACSMLHSYASELKGGFLPYVQEGPHPHPNPYPYP